MFHVLEHLAGAAGAVGTDRPDAVLGLDRRRVAGGTASGRLGRLRAVLPLLRLRRGRHHLRDHVARAHHDHLVAVAHILALEVLLVVQRGELDRDARHLHGLEHGEGDHVAGPAHVPSNLVERRRGGHRRELPGDRAARLAPHHAEAALQLEVVHLHDHAVDLEVERVAPRLPSATGGGQSVDVVVHRHVGAHLEPVFVHPVERLLLRLEGHALERAHAVAPDRQRARRGKLRVELADRAGGRVARVGERGQPGRGAVLVELGEVGARQVYLAAHLEQSRRALHAQRDGLDRAQVLRHVLAQLAVAASGAAHQRTVLVHERDRQAVDLRLGLVLDSRVLHPLLLQQVVHACLPGAELVLVARVGERQHRLEVRHLLELRERLGANALGRRVGREELGMVGLDIPQLVHQLVVLGVRDLGIVEDVVAVVVVVELLAQLFHALLGRLGGGLRVRHDGDCGLGRLIRGCQTPHGSGAIAQLSRASGW